ncbi:MAG TPA: AI-2E family transporter, partial [Candidatus Paceibacterota bacterium]|nr:AI-2E family transporter [Candidatus Paceibacterota bacterium]
MPSSVDKRIYEISWITLWRIVIFASLIAVAFMGRKILLGLFISIIISSGLEFIVDFLERRGLPRSLGVVVVFLSGALILVLLFYAVIPLLIVDLNNAMMKISKLTTAAAWGPIFSRQLIQSMTNGVNQISENLLGSSAAPLSAISDILGNLALTVSVFITSFYLSLDHHGVRRFLLSIIPEE